MKSGRSASLSPYASSMKSLYFDDSLYENEMHYKIHKYLEEHPLGEEYDELIIDCDNEEEYNATLDALFKEAEGKFKIFGVSNEPHELIIAEDPRDKYRKFDEKHLSNSK